MAQASPQKLPRGKSGSYSVIQLSDHKLSDPVLTGLSIATCNPSVENDIKPEHVLQVPQVTADQGDKEYTVSTRMSCNFCAAVFSNRTEQKAHFKSDWHRYNLKQHIKGDKSVTEDEFEALTGEVSSISGSDSTSSSTSDEGKAFSKPAPAVSSRKKKQVVDDIDSTDSESEENAAIMASTRRHPKVFLRNEAGELISLYRAVLYHKKSAPNTPAELLSMAEQAKLYSRVAMVMLAGGHFSAAVFHGTEAVVHKTFHRYVIRAKRGTVQSARDSQGPAPKSGGASLRRYNEAALAQEIQELLSSWSQHLQACHLIFLRTSAYSRNVFFGGKTPIFSKNDQRVRTVPFTTARPTFNEAKRVHHILMAAECFGDESLVTDFVPVSPARHLHPDTGELVVRPDSGRSKPKVKDSKSSSEKIEKPVDKVDTTKETPKDSPDSQDSGGEIHLVEVMIEQRTDHLQEYECSVSMPKPNKKKKKKGSQKDAGWETASVQSKDGVPELSEEDIQLKNQLYTCCRSGDVAQLSQFLSQLSAGASAQELQCFLAAGNNTLPHNQGNTSVPHGLENHSNSERCDSSEVPTCIEDGHSLAASETKHDFSGVLYSEQSKNKDRTSSEVNVIGSSVDKSELNCENDTRTSTHIGGDGESDHRAEKCETAVGVGSGTGRQDKLCELVLLGKYSSKELSLLHVAACAGQIEVIPVLLGAGCDPAVRDGSGKTPYLATSNKDVRNAFRRFRGDHPDRYDYEAAEIPGALTADIEAERKRKEAEKKKAQKKAKQERLKDRKAEEAKEKTEKREKERFLALSDREKRALAAERRLLGQSAPAGVTPVLKRCYQCGMDISGKVPFEYMDFQFCTPKCLKEHRTKHSK